MHSRRRSCNEVHDQLATTARCLQRQRETETESQRETERETEKETETETKRETERERDRERDRERQRERQRQRQRQRESWFLTPVNLAGHIYQVKALKKKINQALLPREKEITAVINQKSCK